MIHITQEYEAYTTYSNDIRGETLHRIFDVARRKPTQRQLENFRCSKDDSTPGYTYYRLYPN